MQPVALISALVGPNGSIVIGPVPAKAPLPINGSRPSSDREGVPVTAGLRIDKRTELVWMPKG